MTSEHGTAGAAEPTPRAGELIAERYELVRDLTGGGDPHIFEGRDRDRDERVRVTLVSRRPDEKALARYNHDLDQIRTLDHPGAVCPRAIGLMADGRLYVVSDYFDGRRLDEFLADRGPLDGNYAARLLAQVLEVLAEAHARGVIHRELKPGNMVFTAKDRIKLSELGTVLAVTGDYAAVATGSSIRLGAPAYTAPELLAGDPATPAADIYSLGLILAEMLRGRPVVEAPTVAQAISAQMSLDAEAVAAELDNDSLAPLVRTALNRDPTKRFTDAAEMLAALEDAVPGLVSNIDLLDEEGLEEAGPETPIGVAAAAGQTRPEARAAQDAELLARVTASRESVAFEQRRGRAWIAWLILLLVLGAVAALYLWPSGDGTEERGAAEGGDDDSELVLVGDSPGEFADDGAPTTGGDPGSSVDESMTDPSPGAEREAPGSETGGDPAMAPPIVPEDGESTEPAVVDPLQGAVGPPVHVAEPTGQVVDTRIDEDSQGPPYRLEVRITSDPSRARLSIDGTAMGRTPFEGVVESDNDRVVATLGKRGHRRQPVRLDMTAGAVEHHVVLRPFSADDEDEEHDDTDDANPFGTINRRAGDE